MPLLEAIYEKLIKTGANVVFQCRPDAFDEIFLRNANEEQLKFLSPIEEFTVEQVDVRLGIWAETNTRSKTNFDPKRQATVSTTRKPLIRRLMERAAASELRWCGTLFPTAASAQDAEMSLFEYEDFVFQAGHLDCDDPVAQWLQIERQQQKIVDYLNKCRSLHFVTNNGTDLRVNVEGMRWINCAGRENFPDGEVFTGPNLRAADGGVNGVVCFSYPAVYMGREVHDVTLHFERGRVTKATAAKGEDFLLAMLDQDDGARIVGEIALGTNYQIQQYTKNTLFDEKIGGTFHLAVGAGYPETGNDNSSGLHWDMVCDLRQGGTVSADGKVISRDGRFLFPDWPQPLK
jgi:aminopeptidase